MPLADPLFYKTDPQMDMINKILSNGRDPNPVRLSKGVYISPHHNMGNAIYNVDQKTFGSFDPTSLDHSINYNEEWTDEMRDKLGRMITSYGVCDHPDQLLAKYDFESFVPKLCIAFCKVVRAEQPSEGGWRWHKWGAYIGTKEPQYEYLYNEKDIDEVYCYHIHVLI